MPEIVKKTTVLEAATDALTAALVEAVKTARTAGLTNLEVRRELTLLLETLGGPSPAKTPRAF